MVRQAHVSTSGTKLTLAHLELIYELAFLRLFNAWEDFLEESIIRYMCGYAHKGGQEKPANGYFRTLDDARVALREGRDYVLWHSPKKTVKRCQKHLRCSLAETVIGSAQSKLEYFAAIRHRIAHAQSHAKSEFDRVSMILASRRYRGSRPGRLLRDWAPVHGTSPRRWLEQVATELEGLAGQIVPM